jgi:hypothetical protein
MGRFLHRDSSPGPARLMEEIMSGDGNVSLEQACNDWLQAASDLVNWLEEWPVLLANKPLPSAEEANNHGKLMDVLMKQEVWSATIQMEHKEQSAICHALRNSTTNLISRLTPGSQIVVIRPQPIFDFLDAIDGHFASPPSHLWELEQLWALHLKARTAIEAMKAVSSSQAAPAINRDNPSTIPWSNEDRDRYILRRRKAGATFKEIVAEINARETWEGIESNEGAVAALKRLCKRTGQPYPHAPGRGTNKRNPIERE